MNIHDRTNYGCGGTFMVWLPALPFMTGVNLIGSVSVRATMLNVF